MNEKITKIFEVPTDAIPTNRGFYYQYLCVLKKWLENFVNNRHVETFTEIDDDIKEVGDELIFTQIKSYTSTFSLNSPEIKKSLFNFFNLYVKYSPISENISFCFSTNTKISPKDALLSKWIDDLSFKDKKLMSLCSKKIQKILIKEIKLRKNKKLGKNISQEAKLEIKSVSKDAIALINKESSKFIKSIQWQFGNETPEDSITNIKEEIYSILEDSKFENKPISLLFSVFLSEIYKCSQNKNPKERLLNGNTILNLLKHTDNELKIFVNNKLTKLLHIEYEILKHDIEEIKNKQIFQELEINSLKIEFKNKPIEYPKNFNLLPDIYSTKIYGWEHFISKIKSTLKEKKLISIYSEGGMGKTTFAKKYLKVSENYDHILWVNVENSILDSFLLDEILISNLGIELNKSDDTSHSFSLILNKLNSIKGANLIVIDIQKCTNETSDLKLLSSLNSWEKLILTRSNHKIFPSVKLPRINFEEAKNIYFSYSSKQEITDELLLEFFNYIDFNILVIELVAKTIENGYDLTLNLLFNSLKDQRLDDEDLVIDIDITSEYRPIRLFSFLIEKFSLQNITNAEKNYLEFLVLLPSNNIYIEDLILINGKDFYNENKIHIINILNSLEKKGFIDFSNDRNTINIHKIIQEVIIYNQRKQLNPFLSSMFYITWLCSRIEECYNSPKNSFRYLRYAESILDSVKEPYRHSIYQPLLLLENELLFAKRFYFSSKKALSKLIDLANRAENYLGLDSMSLGVMYNNLALGYAENQNHEDAIKYFNEALNILKKNEVKATDKIIVVSNNLSNIYLQNGNLESALKQFEQVQSIRKKYSLYNDQQLSIEYRILSKSYAMGKEYKKAIQLLNTGIALHKSLPIEIRNDFYLSAYYSELSGLHLKNENIDEAINFQELAIQILEDMSLQKSEYLLFMYQIVLYLYKFKGEKEKTVEITQKIQLFEINRN